MNVSSRLKIWTLVVVQRVLGSCLPSLEDTGVGCSANQRPSAAPHCTARCVTAGNRTGENIGGSQAVRIPGNFSLSCLTLLIRGGPNPG